MIVTTMMVHLEWVYDYYIAVVSDSGVVFVIIRPRGLSVVAVGAVKELLIVFQLRYGLVRVAQLPLQGVFLRHTYTRMLAVGMYKRV
jgi:hypothetical protein